MEYLLEEINSHFIVTVDGRKYILDTGCPVSWARSGIIRLDIGSFQKNVDHFGLAGKTKSIEEFVECDVDGIIGNDIMLLRGITIDRERHTCIFDCAPCSNLGYIPLGFRGRSGFKYPVVSLTYNKRTGVFIADSGAPIGYVKKEFIDMGAHMGTIMDYYAEIGKYMTSEVYVTSYASCGTNFFIKVAEAPYKVLSRLSFFQTDGVIGLGYLFDKRAGIDPNGKLYTDLVH